MRVALYRAPECGDPLGHLGNAWLGRDPELNVTLAQPDIPGIEEMTQAPRVYGFHATLRPPMRLATGWDEFFDCASALARAKTPFDLPPLRVADLSGFLALREQAPCPALDALADACVRATDPHRRRASPAEIAQRRGPGLPPEQDALLLRWGYPHVLQHWRFHMTLTRRLDAAEMAYMRPAAEAHFAGVLGASRRVSEICIFAQREDSGDTPAPFLIAHRLRLRG